MSSGIRAAWFLQLGYPSESWDDVLATRDLVRDEWPDDVGVSVGTLIVSAGLLALSQVRDQVAYFAAWAVLGVGMRCALYDAAFAALLGRDSSDGLVSFHLKRLLAGAAGVTMALD